MFGFFGGLFVFDDLSFFFVIRFRWLDMASPSYVPLLYLPVLFNNQLKQNTSHIGHSGPHMDRLLPSHPLDARPDRARVRILDSGSFGKSHFQRGHCTIERAPVWADLFLSPPTANHPIRDPPDHHLGTRVPSRVIVVEVVVLCS